SWSVDIPVDPSAVFNPIEVVMVRAGGSVLTRRLTVIVGDGVGSGFVLDGDPSPEAVGMRLGDTGLGQIAPIVESLSGDAIDISSLILDQNPIAQGSFSGISYVANGVDVSIGGFGLDVDATPTGLDTTVNVSDLYVEIDLELGILGSCTLEIFTASADIGGSYDLAPLASDPSFVDVNLVSGVSVVLGGFSSQFVSGACNDPLIGDIVNLILGQNEIQTLMEDGFESQLADPDGAGPLDSPLAGAIQSALAGISIAGPIGTALDADVAAEITAVNEDVDGLSIVADAAITALAPAPGAPDLPASYEVAETFPSFGPTTPVGAQPYGMAFAISSSGLNQLLKAQVENGLLQESLTEFLGTPITAGLLTLLFIPEFSIIAPGEAISIEIRPTMAPVFTGAAGPAAELAEMKIAGLSVSLVLTSTGDDLLVMDVAMDAGVDLNFTQAGLEFAVATPGAQDIGITVIDNPFGVAEANLVTTFQNLFPLFAPELTDALEAFPIPSLLGLELSPIEVSRMAGGYIGLFADLTETPTSKIQNVVFTDLSTGDFDQQGGCWLREWRHRIAGQGSTSGISANLKGMLGADAGCTTNDANSQATAHYRVNFDVVAVAGEQWTLDVDHALMGAYDRISDGYNDGIGFQDGGGAVWFQTAVQGSYRIDGGAPVAFDFNASPSGLAYDGIGGCSCGEYVPFSGSAQTQIVGTTSAAVELEFSFGLEADSDSNTAFPTANGDELAIRLGKNDTIDNNFTAGSYPGAGGRNIADDGHFTSVSLSVVPVP
ncbi:MAG: hypothetical protein HKP30_09810, partial [Myxococcales bacterium]|nr:hypothetical protein [Myxococcales bacterium]